MYYDHHSQTFGRLYSLAAFTVVKSVISLGYHGWRSTEPNGFIPWETLGVLRYNVNASMPQKYGYYALITNA